MRQVTKHSFRRCSVVIGTVTKQVGTVTKRIGTMKIYLGTVGNIRVEP